MNHASPAFHCPDTDEESNAGWVSLNRAISHIAVATETQKDRVRHFQETMKDLQAWVDRLDQTCEKYLRHLGKIRIMRLRHRSLALVKKMDDSLGPRVVGEKGVISDSRT